MSDHQDVSTVDWEDSTDAGYERFSRAKVYTIVAVVCALLTAWFMWRNVFLVPVFGFTGAFCGFRGIKNGGNRPLLIAAIVICLIPALIGGLWLLLLLPNLPSLSFSHVRVVKG